MAFLLYSAKYNSKQNYDKHKITIISDGLPVLLAAGAGAGD